MIQRDYSHKSFYDYYFHRDENARNPVDVKMTEGGRTVFGGGGITPDEKYETAKLDRLQADLYRNGLFNFTRVLLRDAPGQSAQGLDARRPDAGGFEELSEEPRHGVHG